MAARRVAAIEGCRRHPAAVALQTSPPPQKLASAAPFDLRRTAAAVVVPTERERAAFVRPVGGGGWFMPCPADPPDRSAPLLGY